MSDQHMDLEKAAESTFAKLSARLLTPVLLALIAFLGARQLNSMERKQDDFAKKQEAAATKTAEIASDVRDISNRIDYSLVGQVEDLKRRVTEIEKATKTP